MPIAQSLCVLVSLDRNIIDILLLLLEQPVSQRFKTLRLYAYLASVVAMILSIVN